MKKGCAIVRDMLKGRKTMADAMPEKGRIYRRSARKGGLCALLFRRLGAVLICLRG